MSTSNAVEAHDLVKDFGDTRAVDGVSLAVPVGSIYGILGPNGAGKTTTIRMLLGIIDPNSGTRSLLGHERPLDVAEQVGYLPDVNRDDAEAAKRFQQVQAAYDVLRKAAERRGETI